MDKSVGSVTYTLLLDEAGGVRSDLTVARLADDRFQVGANGNIDLDYFRRQASAGDGLQVRDITGATCCIGLWGPRAATWSSLSRDDFSNENFKYFRTKPVPGSLVFQSRPCGCPMSANWDGSFTRRRVRAALWDVLWAEGQKHDVIAAGRAAFNSLRIEKGYRSWRYRHDDRTQPLSGRSGLRRVRQEDGLRRARGAARHFTFHDRAAPRDRGRR